MLAEKAGKQLPKAMGYLGLAWGLVRRLLSSQLLWDHLPSFYACNDYFLRLMGHHGQGYFSPVWGADWLLHSRPVKPHGAALQSALQSRERCLKDACSNYGNRLISRHGMPSAKMRIFVAGKHARPNDRRGFCQLLLRFWTFLSSMRTGTNQ